MPGGTRAGAQGGNTGSVEYSPRRLARKRRAKRRQEERWAAKAGPITVSRLPGSEPEQAPADAADSGEPPA